jgi:uncharacterized protein (DUF1499 family)
VRFPLLTLIVAALGLLLLASAGPTYRIGVPLPVAFALLRWGAYAGIAAAVLAAVAALVTWRRGRRLAVAVSVVALVAGLAAFGVPYQWQRRAQRAPRIHDVTTDLENPPQFEAVVALRAGAPNTLDRAANLGELQREGYPGLQPITLSLRPDDAFERALAAARNSGWEIVAADKASGRIEATDTTKWFGFKDDIVVRLTPWGTGTRVDVRSVSRVGLSDVGTNARRIERFLEAISASA